MKVSTELRNTPKISSLHHGQKLFFLESPLLKQPLSREVGIDPRLICRLMKVLLGFFFLMTDFYLMFFYPSTDHNTAPSPVKRFMRRHGPKMTLLSRLSSTTMTPNKFQSKCCRYKHFRRLINHKNLKAG